MSERVAMAIQFSCSNCQNPIEVDEEFADQMATCPYCRAVLKVPAATTLEAQRPVTARPIDPQFPPQFPPQVPAGYPQYNEPMIGGVVDPAQMASARKWGYSALALSMITLVLGFFYMAAISIRVQKDVPTQTTENMFDPDVQREIQAATARVASTTPMIIAAVGTLAFSLAGIVCAIVGLRQRATWPAITALVLSLLSFSCLSCMSLSVMTQGVLAPDPNTPAPVPKTHPNEAEPNDAATQNAVAWLFGETVS